jgi:hypothetical protein
MIWAHSTQHLNLSNPRYLADVTAPLPTRYYSSGRALLGTERTLSVRAPMIGGDAWRSEVMAVSQDEDIPSASWRRADSF